MNASIKVQMFDQSQKSPDPGLPENFLTSLFKRSTRRPRISCVGARWTAN